MSKVIKVSDIVYSEKGLEMVEYARKLYDKCGQISDMIGKINNETIVLHEEQFSFLRNIIPNHINHTYHQNYEMIYKDFSEKYLLPVYIYLINEVNDIKDKLKSISSCALSNIYDFNFTNYITMCSNDTFGIHCDITKKFDKYRSIALSEHMKSLSEALEYLYYIYYIGTPKRRILIEKYMTLISGIRDFFNNLINDIEIKIN